MIAIMSMLVMSCGNVWGKTDSKVESNLIKAEKHLEQGELYMAKKLVEKVLDDDKNNPRGQQLMAQILDQEISRRMEIFKDTAPEEFTSTEKSNEIKTWIERAKSFMAIHQYDQATLAAEKVFEYEPQNLEASRLLDEIKMYALQEGKAQSVVVQEMAHDESKQRVGLYEKQAEEAIMKNMWGTARLAAEKILLLEPNNEKALGFVKQINQHRQNARENH